MCSSRSRVEHVESAPASAAQQTTVSPPCVDGVPSLSRLTDSKACNTQQTLCAKHNESCPATHSITASARAIPPLQLRPPYTTAPIQASEAVGKRHSAVQTVSSPLQQIQTSLEPDSPRLRARECLLRKQPWKRKPKPSARGTPDMTSSIGQLRGVAFQLLPVAA